MTNSGPLAASSEANVQSVLVDVLLRSTSVTTFRPAAFSACKNAVRSISYHFFVVPVIVFVATALKPVAGLLAHVMADSLQLTPGAAKTPSWIDAEAVSVSDPYRRSFAPLIVATLLVSNFRYVA